MRSDEEKEKEKEKAKRHERVAESEQVLELERCWHEVIAGRARWGPGRLWLRLASGDKTVAGAPAWPVVYTEYGHIAESVVALSLLQLYCSCCYCCRYSPDEGRRGGAAAVVCTPPNRTANGSTSLHNNNSVLRRPRTRAYKVIRAQPASVIPRSSLIRAGSLSHFN